MDRAGFAPRCLLAFILTVGVGGCSMTDKPAPVGDTAAPPAPAAPPLPPLRIVDAGAEPSAPSGKAVQIDMSALEKVCAEVALPAPPDLTLLPAEQAQVIHDRIAAVVKQRTAEAYGRLGHVYRFLATGPKALGPALQCYETAACIDPRAFEWFYHQGTVLFAQGSHDQAAAAFRKAAELNPDFAMTHARLGELCLAGQKPEQAKPHFERHIELQPGKAYGYLGMAVACMQSGDATAALEPLQHAIRLQPQDRTAHELLSNVYARIGDEQHTAEERTLAKSVSASMRVEQPGFLERAVWSDLSRPIIEGRIAAMISAGQLQDAAILCESLLERSPEDGQLLLQLSKLYMPLGAPRTAVVCAQAVLKLDPGNALAHTLTAEAMLGMGELDEALGAANDALENDPGLIRAHYARVNILVALEHFDNAELALRRITELEPDHAGHWLMLANFLLSRKQESEADGCFQRVLELDPSDPPSSVESLHACLALGRISAMYNDLDEAAEQFRQALRIAPGNDRALGGLGFVLTRQGKHDEALALFRDAVKTNPNSAFAHGVLADALIRRGATEEALPILEQAVRLDPNNGLFLIRLGELLTAAGGRDLEAMTHLQTGLRFNPRHAWGHYVLGVLFQRNGDTNAAKVAWDRALQVSPRLLEAYEAYVRVVLQDQDFVAAEVLLRDGLQQMPDAASLADCLAWLLATCHDPNRRNGEEAVRWAKQACGQADNTRPEYLDTLAAAYAEAGRFDEAVKSEKEAIKRANATNRADLAETYQTRLKLFESGAPYHEARGKRQ